MSDESKQEKSDPKKKKKTMKRKQETGISVDSDEKQNTYVREESSDTNSECDTLTDKFNPNRDSKVEMDIRRVYDFIWRDARTNFEKSDIPFIKGTCPDADMRRCVAWLINLPDRITDSLKEFKEKSDLITQHAPHFNAVLYHLCRMIGARKLITLRVFMHPAFHGLVSSYCRRGSNYMHSSIDVSELVDGEWDQLADDIEPSQETKDDYFHYTVSEFEKTKKIIKKMIKKNRHEREERHARRLQKRFCSTAEILTPSSY